MAERAAPARGLSAPADIRRYSRHLLIPEVGLSGQRRLASSRALVVGAGGLGSPVLQYLAAAGVGRLGVMDGDAVDLTNLQRQTIFATADIGTNKAVAAAQRLSALNPAIAIDPVPLFLEAANAREIVRLYDVVVDCTDRFATRYLINDACVLEKKADVYGSIFRFDGQVSVFGLPAGPCYRCLYPQAPPPGSVPTCAEGGVLGALAGIVGAWQASEALKVLLEIGEPLRGRLMLVESLGARVREVGFARDPACALCGEAPQLHDVADAQEAPLESIEFEEVEPAQLDETLAGARLLDVREPHEAVLGTIEGAITMPASQLLERMHELDTATRYVVACRVGAKSLWAARELRAAGFGRLLHLRGGLLSYAATRPEFEFF